ncbi:SecDF P1 head subdomain-containing protein [Dactylosporangium sp. CA-139114]|uniref:SecDF P1 head subdomain-containing protein n=1 Tax=Dactylosporangium sp. CA-139114 TaxID=3239931 RepID=UPI003D96BFC5
MSFPSAVAPPPARRVPMWFWLVLALVVVLLLAAAVTAAVVLVRRFGGGPVKGDVAYTLRVTAKDGAAADAGAVERTRTLLLDRLRKLGVGRPNVTAVGPDTLKVTAAHEDAERVRSVLSPGNLTFRLATARTADTPGGGCKGGAQAPASADGPLASARQKLGESVYQAAAALAGPDDPKAAQLQGFDRLSCAEIAALPPAMQFAVPAITCAMLNQRPADALPNDAGVTACGDSVKYRLDAAKATGADVENAEAALKKDIGRWTVIIRFTPSGQDRWAALTKEALHQQVAILVDDEVVSAPTIRAVITGDAEIAGDGLDTKDAASALAVTLGSGALPAQVTITATDTVG